MTKRNSKLENNILLGVYFYTIISTVFILLSDYPSYYFWFLSSILALIIGLIIKYREKIIFPEIRKLKLSPKITLVLLFIYTYKNHYQIQRHLNYELVLILQSVNVLLFIFLFGFEEPTKKINNTNDKY